MPAPMNIIKGCIGDSGGFGKTDPPRFFASLKNDTAGGRMKTFPQTP